MLQRSLSSREARVILSLEAEGKEELSLDDVESRAGIRRGFARKLAHGLVRKGWIQRVGRGRYLLNPSRHGPDAVPDTDPLRLGSHIVRPYYFGYASAAQLWGFLLQAGPVYYIATPTRTSVRLAHPAQFRFVRVPLARFFGTREILRRGVKVRLSDPERTVIDCVDRPDLSGGLGGAVQVIARAKPRIVWPRLSGHLERMKNRSLSLRVGFLVEHVLPSLPPPRTWTDRWRARPNEPWVPLGPPRTYGRRGTHDPRWHIIQNVPDHVLFAEMERR
ncbi:MAG: type IV toxin-antitoxin system AbiEi family antitoxin domain-containing protein [Thermoplasmata archaeon]